MLYVHPTAYRYDGDANPSRPGGITTIYQRLTADEQRTRQVIADVFAALSKDRNCLVLTNRTSHLEKFADLLREARARPGHSPRQDGCQEPSGGTSPAGRLSWSWPPARTPAKASTARPSPVANRGSLTQYVGRILRSYENKTTAEVHDYLDEQTGVLAAMLAKRAPGYTGLGFPDLPRLALTPSVGIDN